jgi:hypothetical protein
MNDVISSFAMISDGPSGINFFKPYTNDAPLVKSLQLTVCSWRF